MVYINIYVVIIYLGLMLPLISLQPTRITKTVNSLKCYSYLVLLLAGFSMQFQLPETRCALTTPFHPYLKLGGIFSVALSLRSPSPGVTRSYVYVESGLSSPLIKIKRLPNHLTQLYKIMT